MSWKDSLVATNRILLSIVSTLSLLQILRLVKGDAGEDGEDEECRIVKGQYYGPVVELPAVVENVKNRGKIEESEVDQRSDQGGFSEGQKLLIIFVLNSSVEPLFEPPVKYDAVLFSIVRCCTVL